jgi:tetratricopeptide (TPR) repeat protein
VVFPGAREKVFMNRATVLCAIVLVGLCATVRALDEPAAMPPVSDEQIAELIGQLGDREFAVRERAQQQLIKLGFDAFDALVEAEDSSDPEIAMQAGFLVRRIRSQWTRDTDPRPVRQILEHYESRDEEARLAKIKELAALPDDAGLPWLCRLARFEKSPVVSKHAALAIIQAAPRDEAGWQRRAKIIAHELGRSRRPAAEWLETSLKIHADPAAGLTAWAALTETEQRTLEQHPQESSSPIVTELLRRQVDLLDALGRSGETDDVLRRMVLCERGDSASLGELIQWLVRRKAWTMVDLVAERFSGSFDVDAVLLYTLCEARLVQGNKPLADQTAKRALAIHGDSQQEHTELARRLSDRGLPTWSNYELKHVVALGPVGSLWDIAARRWLATSYHDQLRDLEAGDLLRQLVEAIDKDPEVKQRAQAALQQQNEAGLAGLRSDMNFYLACHAAREGQREQQRKLLELSLEQNRANVETIIALYALTSDDADKRAEVAKCAADFVESCRTQIDGEPDDPTFYNQIAWLVANTEGDVEEAIELSQKSVDLARAAGDTPVRLGGLLDTLAHCYFAGGNYAAAVRTQEEAARLDPHTQAIGRALTRFREAQAAQSRKPG